MLKNNIRYYIEQILRGALIYAYVPLSVIYAEVLLRLLTDNSLLTGFPFSLLFALSTGFAIVVITAIIRNPLAIRIVVSILLFLLAVAFSLQYFMYQSYKVFMTFGTIISEAGNLILVFTDIFFSTIVSGIPVMLGFLAPFILYLILTIKKFSPYATLAGRTRLHCIVITLSLLILSVGGQIIALRVNEQDMAAFNNEYNFDTTGRRLGLMPSTLLDVWYSIFGSPYNAAEFSSVALPQAVVLPDSEQDIAAPTATPPPATPSDPVLEPTPTPIVYGYNMLDIDFDKLIENEANSRLRSVHEYVSSLPPSCQNPYTGLFEGKNLIILTAEAFTLQVIDPVMTPTLYRLAHNGFYFSDFYQPLWGAGTAGGEFSIVAGLPPLQSSQSTLVATENNISYTMGNRLMNLGYFSAAFHNGYYTYYNRHLTHTKLGYETFQAYGTGPDGEPGGLDGSWSGSDLNLMEKTVPQYINNSPFSVYYMTYSGHSSYNQGNGIARKNWDAFPEQYSQMEIPIRAYMAANLELEYAMAYLVSELENAGIADDTVIVLASDHYPYGLEKSATQIGNPEEDVEVPDISTDDAVDYLSILYGVEQRTFLDRDKNALILWSGCLEDEHKDLAIEISSPTYTLDILPTLLNLFGLEFDSRMFVGRDVFSDAVPLVLWSSNRSWRTDAGTYHNNVFTPVRDDIALPEDYVSIVRSVVSDKVSYAGAVLSLDYFNTIYTDDGTVRDGVLRETP